MLGSGEERYTGCLWGGPTLIALCVAMSLSPVAWTEEVQVWGWRISLDSQQRSGQQPYCGLNCLYVAVKASGKDLRFVDLCKPEYLDSPVGSTLSALRQAARDAGFHAEIVVGATSRMLRRCPYQAILHVKSDETSQAYDHYVLFVGSQADRARIANPPERPQSVLFSDLVSRWDGKALLLSPRPIDLSGLFSAERWRLAILVAVAFGFVIVIHAVRRQVLGEASLSRPSSRIGLSVVQAFGMGIAAIVVAVGYHFGEEDGFMACPEGIRATQKAHTDNFIPKISRKVADRLWGTSAFFVDARVQGFDRGHIQGAIHVPVDANDTVRRYLVREIPKDSPVVVYCQSKGCKFADVVAKKLCLEGFREVMIFRGGWMEWAERYQPKS